MTSVFASFFQKSPLEELLESGQFTLEQLLDQDDILQEAKAQNVLLIEALEKPEVLRNLLEVATGPANEDPVRKHKLPFVAVELLQMDIPSIVDQIVANEEFLQMMFAFLDEKPPVDSTRAGFVLKVITSFWTRKPKELWAFVSQHGEIISKVTDHISVFSVRELLTRLMNVESPDIDTARWMQENNLIPALIERLDAKYSAETRLNVGHALTDILQNPNASVLASQLLSAESINAILDHALKGATAGFEVLSAAVRKADSEFDVPAPAKTIVARAGELSEMLSMRGQKLVGLIRVSTLELIAALVGIHAQPIDQALADAGALVAALDLFFSFPWNNVVHIVVASIVNDILRVGSGPLFTQLLTTANLPGRLVAAVDANEEYSKGKPGMRLGYMGQVLPFVLSVNNVAVAQPEGAAAEAVKECERWDTAVVAAVTADELGKRALGGVRPEHVAHGDSFRDDDDLPRITPSASSGLVKRASAIAASTPTSEPIQVPSAVTFDAGIDDDDDDHDDFNPRAFQQSVVIKDGSDDDDFDPRAQITTQPTEAQPAENTQSTPFDPFASSAPFTPEFGSFDPFAAQSQAESTTDTSTEPSSQPEQSETAPFEPSFDAQF